MSHICPSCGLDCDCPGNRERCEHLCLQFADEVGVPNGSPRAVGAGQTGHTISIFGYGDGALVEALAALCHEQWSGWMKHLFGNSRYDTPKGCLIPANLTERWLRQMNTPYAELSEPEKDSDRSEAIRILKLLAALGEK